MTRNDHTPRPPSAPSPTVVTAEVQVVNRLGLHTRPSTLVAKRVLESAETTLVLTCLSSGQQAQANSIIALLSLGAAHGARLRLEAQGAGAQRLVDDIVQLFQKGFDEDLS